VPDTAEQNPTSDPNDPTDYIDSDGDLVPNYVELQDGTDPFDPHDFKDTDGGGTPDYVETVLYPNIGLPPSDPNDPSDDHRDTDNGSVSDYQELMVNTNPTDLTDDGAAAAAHPGVWLPLLFNAFDSCRQNGTCQ